MNTGAITSTMTAVLAIDTESKDTTFESPLQLYMTDDVVIHIEGCVFDGVNPDGSDPFEFEYVDGVYKLKRMTLKGWHCIGPNEYISD